MLICLTFGKKHCLVDSYEVCSDGNPGVQNGLAAEGFGVQKLICLKSSPELLSSDA